MRKGLKIKVLPFLLGWFILLAHSIIPHNHISADIHQCKYPVHSGSGCSAENSAMEIIEAEHSEDHVCHLSDLLYLTPSPEIITDGCSEKYDFRPAASCDEIYSDTRESFDSSQLHGAFFLRAPPML